METKKTTKEALQLLGRYIGQKVQLVYTPMGRFEYGCDGEEVEVQPLELMDISRDYIKSFRVTSLRSLDEMSEEEREFAFGEHPTVTTLQEEANCIHYLESIGIDTMNLKDVTILIKD